VLVFLESMLALLLNLLMQQYWEDDSSWDVETRKELYSYFGTFTKSLLTMFGMLFGNWFEVTRVLTGFNEAFMIFGICHQLVAGFAVIEVISGVFLNETFKVAALDDGIMLNEVRRAARAERTKMTELFLKADTDGNGLVDKGELMAVLENKRVAEWLGAMGFDLKDIDKIWEMLDEDGDGQLSCEELVRGAAVVKKPARAVDLEAVQRMLASATAAIAATRHEVGDLAQMAQRLEQKLLTWRAELVAELGDAAEPGAHLPLLQPRRLDEEHHELALIQVAVVVLVQLLELGPLLLADRHPGTGLAVPELLDAQLTIAVV